MRYAVVVLRCYRDTPYPTTSNSYRLLPTPLIKAFNSLIRNFLADGSRSGVENASYTYSITPIVIEQATLAEQSKRSRKREYHGAARQHRVKPSRRIHVVISVSFCQIVDMPSRTVKASQPIASLTPQSISDLVISFT